MKTVNVLLHLFCLTKFVQSGNILWQDSYGEGSYFITSSFIAEALVKRNHNVTFIISNGNEYQRTDPKYKKLFSFEVFEHPYPKEEAEMRIKSVITKFVEDENIFSGFWSLRNHTIMMSKDCDTILSDIEFMERLKSARFDVIVFDFMWSCANLIGEKLNLPRVLVNPSGYLHATASVLGSPVNPAYMPASPKNRPSTPMTFFERLTNVAHTLVALNMYSLLLTRPYEQLFRKHNIKPDSSFLKSLSRIDLALFNMDFAVEAPVPTTSNIKSVGGITAVPPKPLTQELEEFMRSAAPGEGVIVFTLGTYIGNSTGRLVKIVCEAFSRLPYKILWQFSQPEDLPSLPNVKTMKWLPQNDLLGHKKTSLFVFHGGNNGLYEAAYHGVPMIALLGGADQHMTASRVKQIGLGETVSLAKLSADSLINLITKVMTNKTYQKKAAKVSAMMKNRPMLAKDEAAYWIEYVMKYGGGHFQPSSLDLNFYQYHLLDVIAFLLLITTIVLFVAYKLIIMILRFLFYRLIRLRSKTFITDNQIINNNRLKAD